MSSSCRDLAPSLPLHLPLHLSLSLSLSLARSLFATKKLNLINPVAQKRRGKFVGDRGSCSPGCGFSRNRRVIYRARCLLSIIRPHRRINVSRLAAYLAFRSQAKP